MPKLMNQSQTAVQSFQYSGVGVDKLGASEYTLVVIAQDTSTSVSSFKTDMEKTLKEILGACKKSPRSENLLIRLLEFNTTTEELHGFRELSKIDAGEYNDILHPTGWTALYDGTMNALESVEGYSKNLSSMDYLCNAVVFIITDGEENRSKIGTTTMIKETLNRLRSESNKDLESVKTVLIGVSDDPMVQAFLDSFYKDAGLDQFVKMGEASPSKLAKLAEFISRSISSTSQALGTGSVSQSLTF